MTHELAVIIPALKKSVAFPDDIVKKLAGKTLLQRAIERAMELVDSSRIFLITDSEEVQLYGVRDGIPVYWNPGLTWGTEQFDAPFYRFLRSGPGSSRYVLLLSPYAPLLNTQGLRRALAELDASGREFLQPVKCVQRQLFDDSGTTMLDSVFGNHNETHRIEYRGFSIFDASLIRRSRSGLAVSVLPYEVGADTLEINSFQDWWICEKLLQRQRIIFRVIGDERVGMGHIFRALSLAHEISDHEVMFVCDTNSRVAVNQLAGYDYWLGIYPPDEVLNGIIALKPDLVVNDILDTSREEVARLQENGIKVANFEDMGSGAPAADLTINELYDEPQFPGANVLWGHPYFFVRDEFHAARPHRFRRRVDSVLLTFGGTDQHDLARSIYLAIRDYCLARRIKIHIVTGAGYQGYDDLAKLVAPEASVTLTHATGVMSQTMEQCQLAVTSNGRTVYELAHMNVPAIVVSQHQREKTHAFSRQENGFVSAGIYQRGETETQVLAALVRLIEDVEFRRMLFRNTMRFRFQKNKSRVLRRLLALLDQAGSRHS